MTTEIAGAIKITYPEGRNWFYCGEKIEGVAELSKVPKSIKIKSLDVKLLSIVEYVEDDALFKGKDSDINSDDDSGSEDEDSSNNAKKKETESETETKKEGTEDEKEGEPTGKTSVTLQRKELVRQEITVNRKGGDLIMVPFVILTNSAYRGSFLHPNLSRTSLVYTIDIEALKRHMLVASAVVWHGSAEVTLVPHQPITAHPEMLKPSSFTLSKVTKKRIFSKNDGMDMDITINKTAFKASENVSLNLVLTNKTRSATIMSVITRLTMRVENIKNKKKSRTSDVLTDMKGCLNYLPGTKNTLDINVTLPDELPLSESGGNAVFNVSYYLVVFVEDDKRKAQITFPIKVIIGNDGSPLINDAQNESVEVESTQEEEEGEEGGDDDGDDE